MVRHPFQFPVSILSVNASLDAASLVAFPRVAAVFCRHNAALASSAAVERLFSAARQILTSRRRKMSDSLTQTFWTDYVFAEQTQWRWRCKSVILTLNSVNCHLSQTDSIVKTRYLAIYDNDCMLVLVHVLILAHNKNNSCWYKMLVLFD